MFGCHTKNNVAYSFCFNRHIIKTEKLSKQTNIIAHLSKIGMQPAPAAMTKKFFMRQYPKNNGFEL